MCETAKPPPPPPPPALTPEQIAEAERDCRELSRLWDGMDRIEQPPFHHDWPRLHGVAVAGTVALSAVTAVTLVFDNSAVPLVLIAGAAGLSAALWLFSLPEWRTPSTMALCASLAGLGAAGFTWGLVLHPAPAPISDFERNYIAHEAETIEGFQAFQEGIENIAQGIGARDEVIIEIHMPTPRPQSRPHDSNTRPPAGSPQPE